MGRGQEITVTNDGATILKSLYVDNPASKVLIGTSLVKARFYNPPSPRAGSLPAEFCLQLKSATLGMK